LVEAPAVDSALESLMDERRFVGVAVGIAQDDHLVFLKGYGWEDRDNDIPVDPHRTSFRWASVSKGLAGLAAAQAAHRGELDLDLSVEGTVVGYQVPDLYLPAGCGSESCAVPIDPSAQHISLRNLLTHTAGIQHYTNGTVWPLPPYDDVMDPEVNTGMAWALDIWKDAPLMAVPETENSYSTFGYNLAGVAIEQSLGLSFADIVQERIAEPAAMTTLRPDREWEDIPNRAVGYVENGDNIVRQELFSDVSWKLAGGGFTSSVEDFTRYCAGLNTGLLLDEEVRDAELWRVQFPEFNDYGLGFFLLEGDYGRRAGHTGGQEKTVTALAAWPDDGLCITVMTNSEWADPFELLNTVHRAWREGP
jgi:CubicO group peptidase (beta-lactamase class C family)